MRGRLRRWRDTWVLLRAAFVHGYRWHLARVERGRVEGRGVVIDG